jgi:PPIC-type PPIASE domain
MALVGVVGALAVTIGIGACAESSKPVHAAARVDIASEQLRGLATPVGVVARVGPDSITGATFDRFLGAELRNEPASERLVPPDFSTCVAHLQSEAMALGEHSPGPSQLRRECQTRYQTLLRTVLDRLISDEWLIGSARELDVPVNDQEVQASFSRYRHSNSQAEKKLTDIAFETRAKLASQAIRRAIKDRVPPITNAQIADYYNQHRFEYLATAGRDLKIARAQTEASAVKVKAEIASGKSFASVVKTLPLQQPFDSKEGLVLELQPHVYGEPKLNRAIFTATPGVLTGPIGTSYGYFVFDVTRIRFEHETPLARVQASIRLQLARPLQEQALATFMKQWKTTWTARTDCSPGYIAPDCRQYSSGQ